MFSRLSLSGQFTRRVFSQSLTVCLVVVAVLSSAHAFASQVGVVSADQPPAVSAQVLAWWSLTSLACTFIMNLTAPGTPTPWSWNPQVRFYVAAVASVVSGLAHACQAGTPMQTAAVTAIGALLTAVLAHFSTPGAMAKVGAGLLLICGLGASQSACTPAQTANDVKVAQTVLTDAQRVCVTVEAALPLFNLPAPTVAEIKTVCNVENVADQVVTDLIASTQATGAPLAASALAAKAHASGTR